MLMSSVSRMSSLRPLNSCLMKTFRRAGSYTLPLNLSWLSRSHCTALQLEASNFSHASSRTRPACFICSNLGAHEGER